MSKVVRTFCRQMSAFVPLCYCWFTYTYCYAAPPKKLLRILGVINFFVLPTVFFNWNGLFYREFQWLSTPDGFHYVSISYGPCTPSSSCAAS